MPVFYCFRSPQGESGVGAGEAPFSPTPADPHGPLADIQEKRQPDLRCPFPLSIPSAPPLFNSSLPGYVFPSLLIEPNPRDASGLRTTPHLQPVFQPILSSAQGRRRFHELRRRHEQDWQTLIRAPSYSRPPFSAQTSDVHSETDPRYCGSAGGQRG